ncbi:hypothetical protein ACFLS1_08430 [Verrucomicrobiota bacterium]
MNQFIRKGGRLVITLMPRNKEIRQKDKKPDDSKQSEQETDSKDQNTENSEQDKKEPAECEKDESKESLSAEKSDDDKHIQFKDWLGLNVSYVPISDSSLANLSPDADVSGLPESISCHTSICFTNLAKEWNVIYERNGNPVIIEKKIGKGTFVLSALTYFVSNEAMKKERHPKLLTWLIGKKQTIIFDEYHHSIIQSSGIAVLVRQYQLHWLYAGLLILAGLFIWKNSLSLVPPYVFEEKNAGATLAKGKGSASGLINLLRRNISKRNILNECLKEWEKTYKGNQSRIKIKRAEEKINQAKTDKSSEQRDIVRVYNEICKMMKEKYTDK